MTPFPRRASVLLSMVIVLACGGEPAAEEGGTAATAEAAAGPEEALARFAGRWRVSARDEAGGELPGHVVTATADTTGWSITFSDRPAIPLRIVDASGDLVVTQTDPYESVIRPGVRTTVLFVTRVSGDSTRGRLIAMYDVSGSNAILRGTTQGTRQP
jgi:hypothetical protein